MITSVGRTLFQLIFPIQCVGCGREAEPLCGDCAALLAGVAPPAVCSICRNPWIAQQLCPRCVRNTRAPLELWSLGGYQHPLLRSAIYALKYEGRWGMAESLGPLVARQVRSRWAACGDRAPALVPVPLSSRRRRERGFNQSELLARAIARECGWECCEIVRRVRHASTPQAKLKGEQREQSVRGAFAVAPGRTMPEAVIVVDDVWTTGSTMMEVIGALKTAGVKRCYGAVIAVG